MASLSLLEEVVMLLLLLLLIRLYVVLHPHHLGVGRPPSLLLQLSGVAGVPWMVVVAVVAPWMVVVVVVGWHVL